MLRVLIRSWRYEKSSGKPEPRSARSERGAHDRDSVRNWPDQLHRGIAGEAFERHIDLP